MQIQLDRLLNPERLLWIALTVASQVIFSGIAQGGNMQRIHHSLSAKPSTNESLLHEIRRRWSRDPLFLVHDNSRPSWFARGGITEEDLIRKFLDGMRVEIRNRCCVVTYYRLGDLVEKAAEQEAGLAEELKLFKSGQPKVGKTLESQKRTLGELEPPSCPGYKGIIMESAFMWTDMPHGEKLPV
ncbi:hypothetical protein F2Q69_00062277 [Brassica cretica]|uniref:Uncharacterized protein n=1 Tax=Brassica cretica TaxID=69181 RepID=A0A8S9RM77_BRACR|nr:hypothetical protein F2Q69_00062277 [Brassica cretica]